MIHKQNILILLFLILATSNFGQVQLKNNELQAMLEIEIISQTIPNLLFPISPPPPPPFIGTEKETIQLNDSIEKQKEDFNLRVDTTAFYFYLIDSLFIPNSTVIEYLSESKCNGLSQFLFSDTLSAKPINISFIDNLISYSVLSNKQRKETMRPTFGYLGIAGFSRIVFNDSFTQALFYFEHNYDSDSGSGHVILVEKKNGRWEILRNDMIWIS
jgi:hypothetical protein